MKLKRVLKFYFCADSLERAINNMITARAAASCYSVDCGIRSAESVINLIDDKARLSVLWGYLDGVISRLKEDEVEALESYAVMRSGIKALDDGRRREIKRAAVKFSRRAKRLQSFSDALALTGKYYCLLTENG